MGVERCCMAVAGSGEGKCQLLDPCPHTAYLYYNCRDTCLALGLDGSLSWATLAALPLSMLS